MLSSLLCCFVSDICEFYWSFEKDSNFLNRVFTMEWIKLGNISVTQIHSTRPWNRHSGSPRPKCTKFCWRIVASVFRNCKRLINWIRVVVLINLQEKYTEKIRRYFIFVRRWPFFIQTIRIFGFEHSLKKVLRLINILPTNSW